jgi:hypothetical protein
MNNCLFLQKKLIIMKKIYLFLGVSLFCSSIYSQKNTANRMIKEKDVVIEQMPTLKNVYQSKTSIWTNTFGTPADWSFSNNTSDAQNWIISTSTSTTLGYGTGAWVDPSNTVTNEDGYALFDSDFVGANAGTQDAFMTYTGSINCSGYPNVILEFNQRVRTFTLTETIFEVSNDLGLNWIAFPVNLDKNTGTTYQELSQINISSAAGSQANVQIRLRYKGSWDYAWLVDDLKIIEQPANDVRSISPFYSGTNNEGIEYGRTPLDHLDASYEVGGSVSNFGATDATNVAASVSINALNFNYTIGTIPSADTIVYGATETPSTPVGVYNGVYTVTSAEELSTAPSYSNNVGKRNFEVTNNLYSIDGIGVNPTELQATSSLGSNSFTSALGATIFANMYHLRAADNQIGSIEIMLGSTTTAGTEIQVAIIDTATFLNDLPDPVIDLNSNEAISNFYTLTAQDITNGKAVVSFTETVKLPAGAYFAAVLTTENATNIIRILDDQTVVQPYYASMIQLTGETPQATYSNGNAFGIRVNTTPVSASGIDKVSTTSFSVYPNPAADIININSNKILNAVVTVSDITGKVVKTSTINGFTASVNTTGLNNGIYYVTIAEGSSASTQKVVVRK